MEKNWNRGDWQGRRRKQVESNHLIAMAVIGLLSILLLALVIKILVEL
jgi:type IV secretory pathway component VirB8